jgi:hypothetical protein
LNPFVFYTDVSERRGREKEEERWGRKWVGDDEEDGLRVRENEKIKKK